MIARAYLFVSRAWQRAMFVADAAFTGTWLGLLGTRSLHAVDEAMYRRARSYLGDAHNTRGLFDWEERALAAHVPPTGRLAVIGAGGGREVIALARRGYEVRGYECNAALVATAVRLLGAQGVDGRASVTLLARDEPPPGTERFDALIVGWSAYMLMIGSVRRVRFLAGLRERAAEGTPLLLSFFTRSDPSRRLRAVARVANLLRRALRRDPVEVGDDLAPNFVHRFTADEVRNEMAQAGFRMVEFHPQGEGPYDSGWAVGIAEPPTAT
jgi:hypothetical protein